MWPGIALSLEIEEVLYSNKSKFQQIDLYQTRNHGKMLVLDGIIQLTQSDEFAYQEMLAHVPLFAHPNPENVLVIGGGDGGVLREIARHACVKTIDFCEIDEEVIKVSKEFLPDMACGFDDPRVRVHIGDGNAYLREQKNKYDVIIVDSSDPIGPGEALFERPFYENLKAALRQNGIIATQGESFFMHKECVANLVKITKELFEVQAYSYILVPTYPGGNIGICLGSLGPQLKTPCRTMSDAIQKQLNYYTPKIHEASFVLPYFAQKMFETL
ncbi:spermidine synthase [Desulfobacula phenolica]|uniref:Polyamine aminopropyltransferase n=2 Tax=Desulfobacula phenolica TaxID=90732 RepID=A0A1H2G8Y6_9BACT|nr:spermidine synthase [Desulfobacula phenolica]